MLDSRVYLEVGVKRTFAVACDWPGWARAGRDEAAALAALEAYRPRYAAVARAAGYELPRLPPAITERLAGGGMTDFGALGALPEADLRGLPLAERERWAALLRACWSAVEVAAGAAPGQLRMGPRGGGREAAAIVEHVAESDRLHAAGARLPYRKDGDVSSLRAAILDALLAAEGPLAPARRQGFDWTPMFAARRSAWHALDHAWEIEDRS
jgi:hypothetical protein